MAQHEKDPAARDPDAERRATEAVRPDDAQHPDDEAIFAPIADEARVAPDERAHAEGEAIAPETTAPAPNDGAVQPAPAPRRKNRQRLTFLAATLGLLATAGAIGAYRFRDKHEKLAAFAAVVDETFARPEKLLSLVRETSLKWLGDAARPTKKTADAAPERPAPLPPPARVETEQKTAAESGAEKQKEQSVTSQGGDERITWSAPPPLPAPAPRVAPAANDAAVAAARSDDMDALAKRIDQLEQIARSALQAADDARSTASRSPAAAPAQEMQDNLSGLEGRIDELADELRALRERLDAPKSETRLPREQADSHGSSDGGKAANPAAIIVVTHSLQKALERGAPFASEYAALTAQGVDPESLAALAPTAESGAPTARRLLALFQPVAKQLEAISAPKSDAPIGDRLLHGVGKLVKIRPAGDKAASSVPDIVAKINAALERDDVGAAMDAFAELPENEKSAAQTWGDAAKHRLDAEKAAASILSSAIAALGKSKS